MLCKYYKANLQRTTAWFVSGVLRNESNLVLERCLDKSTCEFEFFVPADCEKHFLKVMAFLLEQGFVLNFSEQKNRFLDPATEK